jgi:hypothetical protein
MIQQKSIPQQSNVSNLKLGAFLLHFVLFALNAVLFAMAVYVNVMFSNFQGLIDRGVLIAGTVFAFTGMAAALVGQLGVSKTSIKLLQVAVFLTAVCIAVESGIGGALLGYLGLSSTVGVNSTSTGLAQADALIACSYNMCCLSGCGVNASTCLNGVGYTVCGAYAYNVHIPVAACSLVSNDWTAVCATKDTYLSTVASLVHTNSPKAGYVALAAVAVELLSLFLFVLVISKPRDLLPW